MLQKEFLVNLADGRFAKMQIGLVLAHDDTSTVAAGGHEAAATPPEGYGAMGQEGIVRDLITGVAHRRDRQGAHRRAAVARSSRKRSSRSSRKRPM